MHKMVGLICGRKMQTAQCLSRTASAQALMREDALLAMAASVADFSLLVVSSCLDFENREMYGSRSEPL